MRQISLRIKLLGGKPSFVDKKMDEKKNKFRELSTKEIQEITDNTRLSNNEEAIKVGMRILHGTYLLQVSFPQKFQNFKI